MAPSSRGRYILAVVAGYLVMSAIWIVFSDQMVGEIADPATVTHLSMIKGLVFVGLTASLLVLALRSVPAVAARPRLVTRPPGALLAVLMVAAVGIAAIGVLAFRVQSEALKEDELSELSAFSRLKADEIERWLGRLTAEARAASRNPASLALFARWLDRAEDADREQLVGFLDNVRTSLGFRGVELWSGAGNILLPEARPTASSDPVALAVAQAVGSGHPVLVDLFRDADRRIHLGLVAPLIQGDGARRRTLGAVYLDVDPDDFLYPFLRSWTLPHENGESLLARRDGDDVLYLSGLRFQPDAALTLRLPLATPGLPAGRAFLGEGPGRMEGLDYRGGRVLAASVPISGTHWVLIAKVDKDQALAGLTRLAFWTGGLTLIALMIAAGLVAFLWQRQILRAALDEVSQRRALAAADHRAWRIALETVDAATPRVGRSWGWRWLRSYGLAVALPMATLAVRLDGLAGADDRLLILFLMPILVCAAVGGLGPGLVATGVSALVADYYLIPPIHSLRVADKLDLLQWLVLITLGVLISALVETLRAAKRKADGSRLLRTVTLASIGDGIVTTGPDGRVTFLNAEAERLTGWPAWEAEGLPVDAVFALGGDGALRARDGRDIPVESSGAPIRGADGAVLGVVHVFRDRTERNAAEAALRESEARFSTMFHASPVAIGLGGAEDGRLVDVNDAWLRFYGYERDEVIGRTTVELGLYLRPEQRRAVIDRLRQGGGMRAIELRLRRKDGRERDALYSAELLELAGETYLLAMISDITERKAMELEMRRYGEIVERLAAPVMFLDRQSRFVLVNPAYAALYGLTPDALKGRCVGDLVLPDLHTAIRPHLDAALVGTPQRYFLEGGMPDGRIHAFNVEYNPFLVDGAVEGVVVGLYDVTELRDARIALEAQQAHLEEMVAARTAELAEAEEQARLILESSADGLYGLDIDGRITFVNPAACAMLGWRAEDMIGRLSHPLIHHSRADGADYPLDQCPTLITLHRGEVTRVDDEVYWRADGGAVPVTYATHPMMRDGRIVGAVVSFTDITARAAANAAREQALSEAERLARVRREFLANMSHEIRTPLNAVLALAQLGQRENQGRKVATTFGRILDAGQGLLGVVDDILDFSKIEAGKLRIEQGPLILGDLVDGAIGLIAARAFAKKLAVSVEEGADLPVGIVGDSLRLTQVLGNLLSNAVKFTPSGGALSLVVTRDGERLRLRVADTGIGMTPDQLQRLFQPFEQADGSITRHFGGTGLGLAISRNLVELMGGEITVSSQPGAGSAFDVVLPLEAAAISAGPAVSGRVLAQDLPADEAMALRAALAARGVTLTADAEPAPSLVLIAPGPASEAVEAWLAAGIRVALVVTPNQGDMPAVFRDRVTLIERPIRARHVLAVLAGWAPSGAPEPAPAARRLVGRSILMAEDNEVNRLTLEDLLLLEGATLTSVENGRQAVDRVREAGPGVFDIVLTDVQMPEMDGYQAARLISALAPGLPIIGLTAHALPEERARCLDAGMIEHLPKPIDIDALVSVMLRHIQVRETSAAQIDWARLSERYGDRPGLIDKLLTTVGASLGANAAALRVAVGERDLDRLGFVAHSLKGTGGNLFAPAFIDLAARAERAARAGEDAALVLAERLAGEAERLIVILAQRGGAAQGGEGGAS